MGERHGKRSQRNGPAESQRSRRLETDELATGIFAGRRGDGTPAFAVAALSYNRKLNGPAKLVIETTMNEYARQTGGWELKPYGDPTVWKEIQEQRTERAKQAWAELQKIQSNNGLHAVESIAIRVAELTVNYSSNGKVGGQVDAAVIGSSGVHWIRRKSACRMKKQQTGFLF